MTGPALGRLVALLVALVALAPSHAVAGAGCASVLRSLGLAPPETPPAVGPQRGLDESIANCEPWALSLMTVNFPAVTASTPVQSPAEAHGTWVSDNVAPVLSGHFLPIYEVIEITPGSSPAEAQVVRRLVRFHDPGANDPSVLPDYSPVLDYGGLARASDGVRLTGTERRVVLVDTRPELDAEFKAHLVGFDAATTWRIDGATLVLGDRGPDRRGRSFTYRRRSHFAVEFAQSVILLGETTGTIFPCLVAQADAGKGALIDGLAPESMGSVMDVMRSAIVAVEAWRALEQQMAQPGNSESRKAELSAQAPEILARIGAVWQAPALQRIKQVVGDYGRSNLIFGCPAW